MPNYLYSIIEQINTIFLQVKDVFSVELSSMNPFFNELWDELKTYVPEFESLEELDRYFNQVHENLTFRMEEARFSVYKDLMKDKINLFYQVIHIAYILTRLTFILNQFETTDTPEASLAQLKKFKEWLDKLNDQSLVINTDESLFHSLNQLSIQSINAIKKNGYPLLYPFQEESNVVSCSTHHKMDEQLKKLIPAASLNLIINNMERAIHLSHKEHIHQYSIQLNEEINKLHRIQDALNYIVTREFENYDHLFNKIIARCIAITEVINYFHISRVFKMIQFLEAIQGDNNQLGFQSLIQVSGQQHAYFRFLPSFLKTKKNTLLNNKLNKLLNPIVVESTKLIDQYSILLSKVDELNIDIPKLEKERQQIEMFCHKLLQELTDAKTKWNDCFTSLTSVQQTLFSYIPPEGDLKNWFSENGLQIGVGCSAGGVSFLILGLLLGSPLWLLGLLVSSGCLVGGSLGSVVNQIKEQFLRKQDQQASLAYPTKTGWSFWKGFKHKNQDAPLNNYKDHKYV